jgi:hypothetical protein
MHEDLEIEELRDNLEERLKSLSDLYSSDLISQNTLSSQLLELLCTREAKSFWDLTMKKDMTARRMLTMLEDPDQWEEDAGSPEDQREKILRLRLAGVFLSESESYSLVLEKLLDTASLPHFESIVFTRNGKQQTKKSGAKLSVLD